MTKEEAREYILLDMQNHLDSVTMDILRHVTTKYIGQISEEVGANEIATPDETNKHIIELFVMKRGSKLSQKTMGYYLYTFKKFVDFYQDAITKASEIDVERFLMYLKDNNSERSVNNHRRNLSAIFSWLRKQRMVIYNPCEAIDAYSEVQKPIEHLTVEEHEQLSEGCIHPRDRAMIEFLRCTGVRGGEISGIKIRDIDWNDKKIVIYGEKSRTYRTVCFDDIAKRYMKQYIEYRNVPLDSQEPLFTRFYSNEALQRSGILESIKRIATRSKIGKNVYTHLFRKSVATKIVKRGGTIHEAGEYLGHKDNTTAGKHYAYVDESHTIDIFKKYVAII